MSAEPPSEALTRLQALCTPTSVTILVFYRGEWCPFCTTWARGLSAIRNLPARLLELDAHVVFISSQPVSKERDAAEHFRFARARARERVHFVNDPANEVAARLNERWGGVVVGVDRVEAQFGAGVEFPRGMVQPGVVSVKGLFSGGEVVLWRYMYDSKGEGGVNGGDDRPPACTTLRCIERAHKEQQCS